jgi:hypothetical protein
MKLRRDSAEKAPLSTLVVAGFMKAVASFMKASAGFMKYAG